MVTPSGYNEDGEFASQLCPHCDLSQMAEHSDRRHCGRCGYTEER